METDSKEREKKRQTLQNFAWLRIIATFYLDQFVTNSRFCRHKQLVNATRLNQKSSYPYSYRTNRCFIHHYYIVVLSSLGRFQMNAYFSFFFLTFKVNLGGSFCALLCQLLVFIVAHELAIFFFGCTSKLISKFVYIEEKTYKIRSIIKTLVAHIRIQFNDSLNTDRYLWIAIFQCVSFNFDFSLLFA